MSTACQFRLVAGDHSCYACYDGAGQCPSGQLGDPDDLLSGRAGWGGVGLADVQDVNHGVERVDDGLELSVGGPAGSVRRIRCEVGRSEPDKNNQPDERTCRSVSVADGGVLKVAPGLGGRCEPFPTAALLCQQDGPGLLVVSGRA